MAIAVVQSVKATANNQTSVTTGGINTTTGNLLVACVVHTGNTAQGTLTDNNSLTWTQVGTGLQHVSDSSAWLSMWYVENATGKTGHTFTYTMGAVAYPSIVVIEISGALTSGALDKSATLNTGTAETTHTTASTGTLSQADEIAIGVGGSTGQVAETFAVSSPWTQEQNYAVAAGQIGIIAASQVVAATTALTYVFTSSSSFRAFARIATFKAAAAAAARQQTLTLLGVGT